MGCIFCAIAEHRAEADIVRASDDYLAFRDIHPKAPAHLLVIPRLHISSFAELRGEHRDLIGGLALFAREVAESVGLAASGYNLVVNVGRGGGQMIDHLHFHLLGGWDNHSRSIDV